MGLTHTLIIDENNKVYSFGCNYGGVLGHGDKIDHCWPKMIDARLEPIIQVAAGSYTLMLAKNGAVYFSGLSVLEPIEIERPLGVKIVQISSCGRNSLLLSSDNKLYSLVIRHNYKERNLIEIPVQWREKIIRISQGGLHSLILTESGKVYSFGCGMYGCLGHGDERDQALPRLIKKIKDKKIIDISAGNNHSLLVAETGEVYGFGSNFIFPTLGRGDGFFIKEPKLIEDLKDKNIIQVSTGSNHSLALSKDGAVYSFGAGAFGALGLGDDNNVIEPTLIKDLKNIKIIYVLAGNHISLFLDDKGNTYSVGSDEKKQLGHGFGWYYLTNYFSLFNAGPRLFTPKKINGLTTLLP